MSSLAVQLHFVSAFAVTVAALGGVWVAFSRPGLLGSSGSNARSASPGIPSTVLRAVFALGWLAVAIGELGHGIQISGAEPNPPLVILRSAGYFVLVLALIMGFSRRLSGPVRLSVCLALLVSSEFLLVAVPGVHTGPADALSFVFHLLRWLGGLALIAWLWQSIRTSVQARFVAISILLLLTVVVAISGAMSQVFASNVAQEALRRAEREAEVQRQLLDTQVAESVSRARQVAQLDTVRKAVANRDPILEATVQTLQGPGGPFDSSDFMVFIDPAGAILALSARDAENATTLDPSDAVSLAGTEVVQSALARRQAGSVDTLGPRKVGLIGAFPIFNPPGFDPPGSPQGIAGVVALGRVIDRNYLLDLQGGNNQHVLLVTRDTVLLDTGVRLEGVLLEGAQRTRVFDDGEEVAVQGEIGGVEFFKSYVPLQQTDNEVVGALVLAQRSDVLQVTQSEVARTTFLLALLATAIGVGLSYLSGSRIARPILELTAAAERVRAGDLSARVNPKTPDEIGELGETFDEMTVAVGNLTGELRETAEEEMRIRSRLETILRSMSDGVVAVDDEGAIIAFNREAERVLSRSESDAVGKPINEVLIVKNAAGKTLDLPIYDFKEGSVDGYAGNEFGEPIPVAVTSAPITDDSGKVAGAVAVVRDLTREAEVDKLKTNFLSNISHELRTPLTPIKGYADLLRRKQVPRAKAVTFLDGIIASAERLERIVEMLVDFSAMEAGGVTPRRVALDLDRATGELVGKWSKASPKHRFERRGFNKLPEVEVDEKLIPLAISELMDNAVKFSPEGGKIVLEADLQRSSNGHDDLIISVADSGIGIPADQLSVISDNFAQVDGSATRAYGGMGLGLAYVRRIVESNGGRLHIESKPKKGSRFTLVVPAIVNGGGNSRTKARR